MGRKEDNIRRAQEIMLKPEFIRNIGTAAHIDHGKTTLSDNLIAGAGMMSENLAGKQLMLDFDEQEQARASPSTRPTPRWSIIGRAMTISSIS